MSLAALEATLQTLLSQVFPSLDEALVSYLAGLACEESAPAKWNKGSEALAVWGELLESYEAVSDQAEAQRKCDELVGKLREKAGGKPAAAPTPAPVAAAAKPAAAVAAKPAAAPAPAAKSPSPLAAAAAAPPGGAPVPAATAAWVPPVPGTRCQARYSADGQWYSARVVSAKTFPVARVKVRFVEYGNEEEVAPSALRDLKPPAQKAAGSDDDEDSEDDSDDDSDDEEDQTGPDGKPKGMLLHNPVRIGELGPSRAAARAAELAAEAAAEAAGAGRELTQREQKALRKREAKAERLAREHARATTWDPTKHRSAQHAALPVYLASQHMAKKAGTKDVSVEDFQLLAPDNTELLAQATLKLVYGRRYALIGRNGIGKSTLLRAISSYSLPRFPTYLKVTHVEQEISGDLRTRVLDAVVEADLERNALVQEEIALNKRLKELESMAKTDEASQKQQQQRPASPTESLASGVSAASISSKASAVSSAASVAADASAPTADPASSSSTFALESSNDLSALSDRLTVLYERLTEIDSASALARASTILAGLQFTQEMQQMKTGELSGGWRMRVALAQALFVQPDLLLLDEPTNHLDFPAVLWLEEYLRSYPKTVLVVSHDRTFLDGVITDVIHFTNKKSLEQVRGDYTTFVQVQADLKKQQRRAYEAQQMHIAHLKDFITTFKTEKKSAAQDRKVGQAMSKQKILDKMERDGEILPNPDIESTDNFKLAFPEPAPLRVPLVAEMKHVCFRYPKRSKMSEVEVEVEEASSPKSVDSAAHPAGTAAAAAGEAGQASSSPASGSAGDKAEDAKRPFLLEDINVKVEMTSRIGILGANGCGKSTLIKVLLGELLPVDGSVWLNTNARIAYFTQHHVDQLNLGLTPVAWLKHLFPGTSDADCRRHLAKFGILGELALLQIGNLSGGQRSRLAFSILCWREPHVLILDEPTNHLDLETIDQLILAVQGFKGAVLIISHDQHFLQHAVKEFWSVHNKKLRIYDNLEQCKKATYKQIE